MVCKTQWTHAQVITFPAKFIIIIVIVIIIIVIIIIIIIIINH